MQCLTRHYQYYPLNLNIGQHIVTRLGAFICVPRHPRPSLVSRSRNFASRRSEELISTWSKARPTVANRRFILISREWHHHNHLSCFSMFFIGIWLNLHWIWIEFTLNLHHHAITKERLSAVVNEPNVERPATSLFQSNTSQQMRLPIFGSSMPMAFATRGLN